MDYKDENTWLMLGDCLERMKEIPDGSVDLILTDPPYKMTKNGKSCRPNYMPVQKTNNLFSEELPDTQKWFNESFRVLKDKTHLYVFTNVQSIKDYLICAELAGFKLHNILSMVKDTHMPNRWYLKRTELVLFFRKGSAKAINDLTCWDSFDAKMPTSKNGKLHKTQKPLDVVTKFITNSSEKNETVLDMFMGSGTTGVACKNTNRKFIGIEMDEGYFEIAKNRILS